jgi:inner membrane protein
LDNIAHSLVAVALADLVRRDNTTRTGRRVLAGAAVVAANAPDLDIVYSSITPPPLGFLLHHRGHTHTVLGLLALGVIVTLLCWSLPSVRRLVAADRVRLWILVAAGLGSHVLLDAFNSYGVHPFHPFDSSWYYGDAVFVFEPAVWLLLGVAVAWNLSSRVARYAIVGIITVLTIALSAFGIVPVETVAALLFGGAGLAVVARHASPRGRAAAALIATAGVFMGMFAASRAAHRVVVTALHPDVRGEIVDIVLTPNPGSPLCWSVIGIEKDEAGGEFVLRRGTLSLVPQWRPATSCASYRFDNRTASRLTAGQRLAWTDEIRQPLQRLRDLSRSDCWVRAWLQFGRAPVIGDDTIVDLRFEGRGRANFSRMVLTPETGAAPCPPNVTRWAMPRADLLTPSNEVAIGSGKRHALQFQDGTIFLSLRGVP